MTMLDPNHPRRITLLALLLPLACQAKVGLQASAHAGADGDASASASISVPTVSIHREGDQLVHDNTGDIRFAVGESSLVGERTFATLHAYADVMKAHPDLVVRIEGHTDSRGSASSNMALSRARANAVRDWLVDQGIDGDRLLVEGKGEEAPRLQEPPQCHNKRTDDAPPLCERYWHVNRRSEFHIVSGGENLSHDAPDEAPRKTTHILPYVYGSPGFLQIPIGNLDETASRRPSYRWGLGAGALWRRERLAVAFGMGLSHSPIPVKTSAPTSTSAGRSRCDDPGTGGDYECKRVDDLQLTAELRIGGGSRRVIGYALLAPGLAIGTSKITGLVQTAGGLTPQTQRFVTPGFALDLGAGLWGRVWRGLFLGAEALFDFGIYRNGDAAGFHEGTRVTSFALRALIGWQFGWRRTEGGG